MKSTWKRLASGILASCMATSMVAFAADTSENIYANVETDNISTEFLAIPETAVDIFNVTVSENGTPVLDGWDVTVLDEKSYRDTLVNDVGLSLSEAEQRTAEMFSASNSISPRRADRQTVKFSRYRKPGGYSQYEIRFGFVAVMTTGSTPLFVSIDSKYANASGNGKYTFSAGAKSAVITNSTTVKMDYDGYVEVPVVNGYASGTNISASGLVNAGFQYSRSSSSTKYYRAYVSCYDTVRPSWVS